MANLVGVRFELSAKVYFFDAGEIDLAPGDTVVVESDLGVGLGRVVKPDVAPAEEPEAAYKPILRRATDEDLVRARDNEALRAEARAYFNERVMARGLPMKLLGAEVTLDRKRLLFYFIADNRIDFRELVKDLASRFRTRIELRQIGVRDAAKLVGGFGVCGREFCCSTFLQSFAPISIKMAKQQGLVLNTCKLSGQCGRLMCCLNYEYDENAPRVRPIARAPRQAEAARDEAASVQEDGAAAAPREPVRPERPRRDAVRQAGPERREGGSQEPSSPRVERGAAPAGTERPAPEAGGQNAAPSHEGKRRRSRRHRRRGQGSAERPGGGPQGAPQ